MSQPVRNQKNQPEGKEESRELTLLLPLRRPRWVLRGGTWWEVHGGTRWQL